MSTFLVVTAAPYVERRFPLCAILRKQKNTPSLYVYIYHCPYVTTILLRSACFVSRWFSPSVSGMNSDQMPPSKIHFQYVTLYCLPIFINGFFTNLIFASNILICLSASPASEVGVPLEGLRLHFDNSLDVYPFGLT